MTPRIYEEVIELIASEPTAEQILAFMPSDAAKARLWVLINREKNDRITAYEKLEIDYYMYVEHIMHPACTPPTPLYA